MTCREFVEFLIDYLDGDVSQETRAHIEEHLHCCSSCGHFCQSYQITIKISRQLPCSPMPSTLDQKLKALLEQAGSEE